MPPVLLARPPCACARLLERLVVGEELVDGLRKAGDVARRNDPPRPEALHRLGEAAHVVHDRGHAGAERPEESAALVELGPVREHGHGRLPERTVELSVREEAEPPLDAVPACGAIGLQRLERIACDEQPRPVDASHRLDRVAEPPVRTDHAEREHRGAVVSALHLAPEHGVRDHHDSLVRDAELGERRAPALAVHDDPLEAAEQLEPQRPLARRAARQQVVRREHRGRAQAQQPGVQLRNGEPLDVRHVRLQTAQRASPSGCSTSFTGSRSRERRKSRELSG